MNLLISIFSLFCLLNVEVPTNQNDEPEWRRAASKVFDNTTRKFSNGRYKGQIYRSKRSGLGAYLWDSGASYWGIWKDGNRNGVGILISPQGYSLSDSHNYSFYVGEWVKDKKEGIGRCYDVYGQLVYYGEFKQDKLEKSSDVSQYDQYRFDRLAYPNECQYIGETKDSKRHGYGIYIWADGDAWFGHWEEDKQSDNGIYLHYEGKVEKGHWENSNWIGVSK